MFPGFLAIDYFSFSGINIVSCYLLICFNSNSRKVIFQIDHNILEYNRSVEEATLTSYGVLDSWVMKAGRSQRDCNSSA